MTTTRRTFLQHSTALTLAAQFPAILRAAPALDAATAAAERCHAEIWRRLVDSHDVVLDYTDLDGSYDRATPEECRLGKPNALGWWTPIENGAMFNGQYIDAAILRTQRTADAADNAKARRLAEGMLRLASVSDVKGFVARGFATDGKTSYPMGSNDQTGPWFYGLYRYVRSGLADAPLRARIVAKMTEVADVLEQTAWRMPAAEPFKFRGSFAEPGWDGAPRLLFLMKAMLTLTGDAKWARHYERTLHEKLESKKQTARTGLEACALGVESRPNKKMWTGSVSVVCLRELWELERDEQVRAKFAQGLAASAEFAATVLPQCRDFANDGKSKFEGDWRKLLPFWKPQRSIAEAEAVAREQLAFKNRISPRRREEALFVREPAFAAWIVSLCPDLAVVARHRAAALETIAYYRYEGLRYSQFFAVESAAERLRKTG
jgi:hypothetical protein